ncbi:MAG: O-antigen ligase family protein [Planctomycetota bacterium]|nr:O-antigen ligase family protein [Planctomycetota bacterium]
MSKITHSSLLVADHSPKLNLWMSLLYVLVGWAVALFVKNDGIYSHRLQVEFLGPNPLLVNDVPFLGSLVLIAVCAAVMVLVLLALKSGSADRVVLGLFAFSLCADVVPMLFQFSLLGLLVVLAKRGLFRGNFFFRLSPLFIFVGLILISYSVSFLQAAQPLSVLPNFSYRVTYVFMMLCIPAIMVSMRHIETLFDFMLVAAILTVGVEVAQYILSIVSGQIVTFAGGKYTHVVTSYGIIPRLTGLMYHPNHQSNLLASQAVMALWLATQPKGAISRRRRLFLYLSYVILAFGVVITMSRSGWLSIAIVTVLMPMVRLPRMAPWYFIGVSILGAVAYQTGLAATTFQIIHDMNGDSADFRWHVDDIAMDAFFNNPWFGVGVGMFLDYFNPYQLEVHDTYLQVASGMGVFGLVTVGGFVIMLLTRTFKTIFRPAKPIYREWAIAVMFALIITSIQAMFAMFLWVKFLWAIFGIAEAVNMNNRDALTQSTPKDFDFLPPQR